MKNRHNGGFSLIETLIAIVVLGIIVVPVCTSLLLAVRINTKTEELLQAQLAVSSAVETLMAEGISADRIIPDDEVSYPDGSNYPKSETYADVTVIVTQPDPAVSPAVFYKVIVASKADPSVSVTTTIRAAGSSGEGGGT